MSEAGEVRARVRIPFDPREQRVVDSMARWMGVLGRFQVLAGGLLLLTVLGVAIAYGTTEAFAESAQAASPDAAPPLVVLGQVTLEALIALGAAVSALGALLLGSGVTLIDAAEDFERVVHAVSEDAAHQQRHLEDALRRMRSHSRVEALLALLLLAAVLAWAIPGWA